jgi:hypothetical protein
MISESTRCEERILHEVLHPLSMLVVVMVQQNL